MKKTAILLVLGLILASVPVRVLASGPPPGPTTLGSLAGAAILGVILFDEIGSGASAKAKTGDEFADLNNNPNFKTLLSQQAGGEKNTLDLLK